MRCLDCVGGRATREVCFMVRWRVLVRVVVACGMSAVSLLVKAETIG